MSPAGRAFFGAAVSAVLTLIVHPSSRSFVLSAVQRHRPVSLVTCFDFNGQRLSSPDRPETASLWMQLASERLVRKGVPLSAGELSTLDGLCLENQHREPENAFWPQMRAVFLTLEHKPAAAAAAWRRAADSRTWNDYQTKRLLEAQSRLSTRLGASQAWQYGYVFFGRSDAAASLIQHFAQALISHSTLDDKAGLETRYETIRNGSLLRDGSRSLRVGAHGAAIVELASYPPSLSKTPRPKRLWIAETGLTSRLRSNGMAVEAATAAQGFEKNDAWRALTEEKDPDETIRYLCLASLWVDSLPGCLFLSAALGWLLFAGAVAVEPLWKKRAHFPPLAVLAVALSLALVAQLLSRSWVAALSVGLSTVFLAAGPINPRARKGNDLGPLFNFVVGAICLISLAGLCTFLLGTTTGSRALLPLLGPAGEYLGEGQMFLGVACIVASLLFLAAPAYAIVHRYGTPGLTALTLRKFGWVAGVGGMALGVIAGPLAVYMDHTCRHELSNIVQNEPVYYLTK